MPLATFNISSTSEPIKIQLKALNARKVDGFVRTYTPDRVISRKRTVVDSSTVEWSFRPTPVAPNMIDGIILNADLPGSNVIRRTITQGGELIDSSTENPKDFQTEPSPAGASASMSPEFFVFKLNS